MGKGIVVVIDDSFTVRKLAEVVLNEEGYRVYTAEDGEEGLELAVRVSPSIILVDFIMPKMNGYEFCKNLRLHESLKDVPVILITAKGEEVGERFTNKFGVVDYFIKPFQPENLVEKVNSIMRTLQGPENLEEPDEEEDEKAAMYHAGNLEEVIDKIINKYFSRELPFILKKSISDILKQEGVGKAHGVILSGDFSEFSFFDIFQLIDTAKSTGKLSVYSRKLSSEIYFDKGCIVYAYTSRQGRKLLSGDLIKKRINISDEAFNRISKESKTRGVPLLRAFVNSGALLESEATGIMRELIDEAIYTTMEIENGNFYFEKMALPDNLSDIPTRLNASLFILEGARRIDEKKYAAKMLPDNDIVFVRLMTDVAMEDLKLDSDELKVFSLVDGRRTMADIIMLSGIEENEAKRILYTLIKVGILKY